jgi:glutaminyl-tRNA synthetase
LVIAVSLFVTTNKGSLIFARSKIVTMSEEKSLNFIEEIIEDDLKSGKYKSIVTRFPPEPNGYLHIGHATSINLNFGLSKKYGGYTNLRFDDTNPVTEETEYVDSIKEDVRWLGFEWKNEHFASDYFEQLYAFAIKLIQKGLAYVDDSTPDQIAALKGTPTEPGHNSPYRERSIEDNLRLFKEMRLANITTVPGCCVQKPIWLRPT